MQTIHGTQGIKPIYGTPAPGSTTQYLLRRLDLLDRKQLGRRGVHIRHTLPKSSRIIPDISTSLHPHSRSPFATAVICCKKALPSSSGLIFSICCSFSITPLSVEVPTQSQPYFESDTQTSSRITLELQSIASTRDDQTSIESHFIAIPPAGSYTDPLSPPRSATPPLRKHGQSKPISEDVSELQSIFSAPTWLIGTNHASDVQDEDSHPTTPDLLSSSSANPSLESASDRANAASAAPDNRLVNLKVEQRHH
ncbi:hypothetical protein FIBSPDRAFT_905121 [Athelia psychrophila]|uniref:Uncharacterized protein n=1 Tax=Athelia psychrophila TaxID=1759441 RepID=A0A167TUD7_9AGAM|nr:hypothetical protein FIBSPDRAFT_905121 [Fibularhizoctonia sp. CBS 109695]